MSGGGWGVVAFIVTVLVMVIFHEFGHFTTARRFGIKVEEFFVGFGPRLLAWRRGETDYGLKAILLGGYVRISGMNPFQTVPEKDAPRTFGAKPAWQRAIVLSAGSFTHFVLATVVFAVLFSTIGVQDLEHPLPQVSSVSSRVGGKPGPASQAGLKKGDRIISISGSTVKSWDDVRKTIRKNAGRQLMFEIDRHGRRVLVPVTPVEARVPTGRTSPGKTELAGQIGIAPEFEVIREAPPRALWHGITTTGRAIKESVKGIVGIFSPRGLGAVFKALESTGSRPVDDTQPVGLVGSARLAGQATAAGSVETLIQFLGFFVVFVGVINLVPLPPLDGGHLAVLAFEKLTSKSVDMRKVIPIAGAVVAFFAVLSIALLYLDIFRPLTNPFQ